MGEPVERVGSWRVAFADEAPRSELGELLGSLADPGTPEGARIVKSSRIREVFRIALGEREVFVKRDLRPGRASRARMRRELRNLQRVRSWGLPAVEPLCMAERDVDAVLITVAVDAARAFARAPEAAEQVGHVVRRLHDAGGWHRDLHRGNVLVAADGPVLVDLQKLVALPVAVPSPLRVRDLAMLAGHDAPDARALLAAYAPGDSSLPDRVRAAAARRRARRLRSRGRRCVLPSTGFRVERCGGLRVYRRADVDLDDVLAALRESGRERVTGGPPAGPAPDPFARGHGAAEPGTPATGPVAVRELPGSPLRWGVPSSGMRAWRGAHAALLRGFETPAPLALVEELGGLGVRRSWLLSRGESFDAFLDGEALHDRCGAAERLARALGAMHESGLCFRAFDPRGIGARPIAPETPVLRASEKLRVRRRVRRGQRRRDLARLAAALGEPDRGECARLVGAYRESGAAGEAVWRRLFPEAASSR